MRVHRLLVVPAALAVGVVLTPGVAQAHPVGTPGEPRCFGDRISHGSSDHAKDPTQMGGTPKERAALLSEVIVGIPEAEEFFGTDGVSVQEFIRFVKINCSDEPIIP